jgi:hypothetical protein
MPLLLKMACKYPVFAVYAKCGKLKKLVDVKSIIYVLGDIAA